MAIRKTLASGWVFEIGDAADPEVFTGIKGANTWSEEWTENEVDNTDFQSGNWNEHGITRRGLTITVEGFFLVDESDGSRDAGQTAVETIAQAVGQAAYANFRVYHDTTGLGFEGEATYRLAGTGGGTDDNAEWGFTAVFNGAPEAYDASA